jgi:DNA-binding LacI/PurR family transcriptional regulator
MPARRSPVTTTAALARHLGLSRTTVSRALNDHPKVHPETSAAIRTAMQELGFAPNAPARSLRGGRTRLVGVCFRYLAIPIHVRKVEAVGRELRAGGWRPSVELLDEQPELWREVAAHFAAIRAEGVVFIGTLRDEGERACFELLEARGIPVVLLDPLEHAAKNTVSLDRRQAMRLVAEHLVTGGHRRFGLVGITGSGPVARLRRESFGAALRAHGLEPEACLTEYRAPVDSPSCVPAILATRPRPTALVAINDSVALRVLHDLRRHSARVPEECSVVGFDNLDTGAWSFPSLTTVDQDVPELAQRAVAMLARRMADSRRADIVSQLVAPRLVVRESTAPVGDR